jgi:ribosomal-protein-alanine N-acetyltransferase
VPKLRFPTPPLAEETVLLRPWRAADVPENLMAFSDPVVQRFSWSPATPHSEDDACGYFVDQEQARLREEEVHFALVEPKDENEVSGGVSLYPINLEQGRAATGYWLVPRPVDAVSPRAPSGCLRSGRSQSWRWRASS